MYLRRLALQLKNFEPEMIVFTGISALGLQIWHPSNTLRSTLHFFNEEFQKTEIVF